MNVKEAFSPLLEVDDNQTEYSSMESENEPWELPQTGTDRGCPVGHFTFLYSLELSTQAETRNAGNQIPLNVAV